MSKVQDYLSKSVFHSCSWKKNTTSSCAHLESQISRNSCIQGFGVEESRFAAYWYALRVSRVFQETCVILRFPFYTHVCLKVSKVARRSFTFDTWGRFQHRHIRPEICEGVDEVRRLTHWVTSYRPSHLKPETQDRSAWSFLAHFKIINKQDTASASTHEPWALCGLIVSIIRLLLLFLTYHIYRDQ